MVPNHGKAVQIYVICHDEATEHKSRALCALWENPHDNIAAYPLRVHTSPYMESAAFLKLVEDDAVRPQWWPRQNSTDDCYVAVVTHSIIDKLARFGKREFRIDWRLMADSATAKGVDVLGLFGVEYYKNKKRLSPLEGSVFQHGLNFYLAWDALTDNMGLQDEERRQTQSKKQGQGAWTSCFFCNWWMAEPRWMMEYALFVKRATIAVSAVPKLVTLFDRDAYYGSGGLTDDEKECVFGKGRTFYTIHPFVFERLPAYFFQIKGARAGVFNLFAMHLP